MTLFCLFPADPTPNAFLLWTDDARGRRVVRDLYRDLVCPSCGKIDELVAIERGFDPSFRVRSKREFVGLADNFVLVGAKFLNTYQDLGLKGLRFLGLPDGRSLAWPEVFVPVDRSIAGMQFVGNACIRCGRYSEVVGIPRPNAVRVPDEETAVFSPGVWLESRIGRMFVFYVKEPVAKALRAAKLSGLEVVTA